MKPSFMLAAKAAVAGCPGIRVLLDDELSISLMGERSSVPSTWPLSGCIAVVVLVWSVV